MGDDGEIAVDLIKNALNILEIGQRSPGKQTLAVKQVRTFICCGIDKLADLFAHEFLVCFGGYSISGAVVEPRQAFELNATIAIPFMLLCDCKDLLQVIRENMMPSLRNVVLSLGIRFLLKPTTMVSGYAQYA